MLNDMFQPIHLLVLLIFGALMAVVFVVPLWVSFKKAGLSPALSLLLFVPFGLVIVLYLLAFLRWRVMPSPEYALGYPRAYPPPGYPPAAAPYPPAGASVQPGYVPPANPPSQI